MQDASPVASPALLPERRALCGPITRRRLARLGLIYAVVFAAGLLLAYSVSDPHWQAFGLGLTVPGGGFFAHADTNTTQGLVHLGTALLAVGAFAFGLLLWFATGNVIAPPALWLLFAALAALMDHGGISHHAAVAVPLGVVVGSVALFAMLVAKRARHIARRREANLYLQHAALHPEPAGRDRELSAQDVKLMRFLLDRALQPVETFDGFEWLDQFQTAAVRYQLNFSGYALSMAQATYLPAFGGYLNTAQQRLIDKQTDHRIWRYWAIENLWGNLALDPDPVARENIMFTGFVAAQMAMYHAASGRRNYDRPGSFPLRHPDGRRYDYDFGALVAALDREQTRSDFALVACEPNWIYPLCNTIGAAAMKSHDRMQGSDRWLHHARRFRERLEHEFIDLAGRIVPCRSNYTGLALPMIGGAQPQAMPSFFLNATFPDIALRQWLLLRRGLLQQGGAAPDHRRFWKIDTGNYRYSRAAAFAGTALAAVEIGDREVAQACLEAIDRDCPPHSDAEGYYRPDASVWAHAVEFFARCSETNGFRRLIETPQPEERRMLLDDAAYPEVLVASAVAAHDVLTGVLYPGITAGEHEIGFSGLRPHGRYACDGMEEGEVLADRTGTAKAHVLLSGRTEIRLRPVS
jgi:Linalool dehydratase/isomerase